MITFYHAPRSRSGSVLAAIEEMGLRDRIEMRIVSIQRQDGSGQRDPANPHPEGKAPCLVHDGTVITERAAIMLHLAELFPEAGLGRPAGTPEAGALLAWMTWYAGVFEPVLIAEFAGVSHPAFAASLRGRAEAMARLSAALADGRPWLLASGFSMADLLVYGPFGFFKELVPEDPKIRAWIDRVAARPGMVAARAFDTELLERAA